VSAITTPGFAIPSFSGIPILDSYVLFKNIPTILRVASVFREVASALPGTAFGLLRKDPENGTARASGSIGFNFLQEFWLEIKRAVLLRQK
jgi:hypothetical protein